MTKVDPEVAALKEQVADAQAQIDSLQAAVADAEARAASQSDRLAVLQSEAESARSEGERLTALLQESAIKYREARLAASPEIPAELVTAEDVAEIDEQFADAERLVAEMRERVEKEQRREAPAVPAGAPVRRSPDLSGLPASEKIRMGLERKADG